MNERLDWLRLARTEAVGAATFAWLLGHFGTAGDAIDALPEMAKRGGRSGPLKVQSREDAARELAAGEVLGARLILGGDPDFPRLLAVLDAPPPLIWALGDAALLARRTVAIVGARSASTVGRRFAGVLAADLGAMGFVVVSGLARGIDAAAHQGSLETGTVPVLAGGVDDIYPPENAALADTVRVKGCLVSERPPGFRARAQDFPRRNRIISGLSLGVIVVEAELRSGSLITARLAGEQGRDVFAVPGSPMDPRARGCNNLLRQGAVLVEEAEDVRRVLDLGFGVAEPSPIYEARADEPAPAQDAVERLAALLSPAPVTLDQLARDLGLTAGQAAAGVVELALAGRAEFLPGGLVVSVPD